MSAYDHIWGKSQAADEVWCHVNGLAPARACARQLMVWQACIDESMENKGVFVIGGYLAPAENWAKFSADWEQMLPAGYMRKDGHYAFKMSEMAATAERMSRVPGFFRIIEKHIPMALHVNFRMSDFIAAKKRIIAVHDGQLMNFSGKLFDDPYFFGLGRLMTLVSMSRLDTNVNFLLPKKERVDFICDDGCDKKIILEAYDRMVMNSKYAAQFGRTPRFEDDIDFLPLQAADFLVWWVRRWRTEPQKYKDAPFPWQAERDLLWLFADFSQAEIVRDMMSFLNFEFKGKAYIRDSAGLVPPIFISA